jgi:hypothetical protein
VSQQFWLVDLGGKRLVRHRSPQHGAYALVEKPELDTPLEVSALSGVVVDLHRLCGCGVSRRQTRMMWPFSE